MTLDQLMEEWRKDSTIDSTELGVASMQVPELHSKYLKIYFEERRKLKAHEFSSKDLFLKKYGEELPIELKPEKIYFDKLNVKNPFHILDPALN